MAPRGRKPKKKDNARMDAAIGTMQMEYGISDVELIKKVVNQLLDAYGGGEEAWYFIELYTYQELLEGIVRCRGENPEENNLLMNSAAGGDSVEDNSLKFATAGSREPIYSEVVDRGLVEYKDGKEWKDIRLDLASSQRDSRNTVCDDTEENSASVIYAAPQLIPTTPLASSVANRQLNSPLLLSPCLTTADSAPARMCRPFYGWIENDDEEDLDDFLTLKPAKATAKRSRSKWDLKPEDP